MTLANTPVSMATTVSASGYRCFRSCRSLDVFGLRTAATAFAPAASTCRRQRMRLTIHPIHTLASAL